MLKYGGVKKFSKEEETKQENINLYQLDNDDDITEDSLMKLLNERRTNALKNNADSV